MLFHLPFFVVVLCCTLQHGTAPKASKTYEELLQENKDKDLLILSMNQEKFMKACSTEHLYNQRFFENAYMSQEFIDQHKGYRILRDNFSNGTKFSQYVEQDPKIPQFQSAHYSSLSPDQQNIVRVEFGKNKRLTQAEKWPLFLDWLVQHHEEWQKDNEINERLLHFYNEYIMAKNAGLTSDVFTECILNAWQRSSEIVAIPEHCNFSKIFTKFLEVTNPWYVATKCGTLLKRAIAHAPISHTSAEKYL